MRKFTDVVQARNGTALPGATVTVRVANVSPGTGALATIYSDDGVTTVAGSAVVTDSNGRYSFYAVDGRYDLTVTGTGITTLIVPDTGEGGEVLSAKKINEVRYADQFPGADAGAKITAALADLPSTGGLVDACGLQGAQGISATVPISTNQTVKLGYSTFTSSITPAFILGGTGPGVVGTGASLLGSGIDNTVIKFTGTGSLKYGVGISSSSGSNSSWNKLKDLTIDLQGVATSTYSLALGGAWYPTVENVRLLGASIANGAGLFVGTANIYADTADGGSYFGNFTNIHAGSSGHGNYFGVLVKGQATTGNNFHNFRNLWSTYNSSTGIYLTSGASNQAVSGTEFIGGGSSYNGANGVSLDNGAAGAVFSSFDIESNTGWGITNTVDTVSITAQNLYFSSNGSGNYQQNAQYIDLASSGLHVISSGGATPNSPTKAVFKTNNNPTYSAGVEQRTPFFQWDLTSLGTIYLESLHATNDSEYIRFTDSGRTKAMWFDSALGRVGWNYSAGLPSQFWSPGTTGTVTFPSATCTLVGKDTTDVLTNKTYDTAGAGNSLKVNGVAVTDNNGTGKMLRESGAVLLSPTVGASGTVLTQVKVYSQTITPASVNAATASEQTFTVTGLTTADKVVVNPAATGNSTMVGAARVSAADTIAIEFTNPTAGALTPGSGTYNIIAFRS